MGLQSTAFLRTFIAFLRLKLQLLIQSFVQWTRAAREVAFAPHTRKHRERNFQGITWKSLSAKNLREQLS